MSFKRRAQVSIDQITLTVSLQPWYGRREMLMSKYDLTNAEEGIAESAKFVTGNTS
jgi:hypothetical protein